MAKDSTDFYNLHCFLWAFVVYFTPSLQRKHPRTFQWREKRKPVRTRRPARMDDGRARTCDPVFLHPHRRSHRRLYGRDRSERREEQADRQGQEIPTPEPRKDAVWLGRYLSCVSVRIGEARDGPTARFETPACSPTSGR